MSEASAEQGLIGPNAVLQMVPALEHFDALSVLEHADIGELPDGTEMIPQGQAARLHQQLRSEIPHIASGIADVAGRNTADYILAHRIPKFAQFILRLLPPYLSAILLSRAIAAHAWTFAGTGVFRAITPWEFEIRQNPLIEGETSSEPICVWHAAVFQRLYQKLVHRDFKCVEVECGAQTGHDICRFQLFRQKRAF